MHTLHYIGIASVAVVMIAGVGAFYYHYESATHSQQEVPGKLIVTDFAPIGLIGTVTELGSSTVTIVGTPAGNSSPITLTASVDAKTSITKVGAAPKFATSTAMFADFTKGMKLSIAADGAENGLRHAERIIIPPQE